MCRDASTGTSLQCQEVDYSWITTRRTVDHVGKLVRSLFTSGPLFAVSSRAFITFRSWLSYGASKLERLGVSCNVNNNIMMETSQQAWES